MTVTTTTTPARTLDEQIEDTKAVLVHLDALAVEMIGENAIVDDADKYLAIENAITTERDNLRALLRTRAVRPIALPRLTLAGDQ